MKNKKGQTSEFVGITLLVIVLTIILLFSKLSSSRNRIDRTESSLKDYRNTFISTSVTKFPYITYKGVSINEMLGTFMCYKQEVADYGRSIGDVELIKFPQSQLDELYEKNKWKLELDEKYCMQSESFEHEKCKEFTGEYITYEFYFSLPCRPDINYAKIYITS